MKITCDREQFSAAFQIAANVAPSRNTPKPILENVKLEVADQSAILLATNLEVGVRIEATGIEVHTPGSAVLPVDRVGSILKESNDDQLRIEVTAKGISIKGDRSEFKLQGKNPDEFPHVETFNEDRFHEVPARLFKELIRRTLFATDPDSGRYALGGALLEMEQDKIIAVGTDGRRLAKMEGPAQSIGGHLTGDAMVIVPKHSLQLMDRILADDDAEVQISARHNDILVRSPRAVIYSRLVEGRFPKWRDVFPVRRKAVQVNLAVGPMYAALRQAAVVASTESRGIDFTFHDGSLVLSGLTAEVGESRVELPIAYDADKITLCMDHRYVADFLRVLDPEKTFTLEIENDEAAALFTTDDGYGYVVMPLSRDRKR